ncbi:MAG: circadian clock protein KaiB [Candidatus Omnitrophica bacterium]|nr:circadian clock protein KaiB [Candidatus Omnitrophota bacterium]
MAKSGKYILKLYIAGQTANSLRAINNLEVVLKKELRGVYALEIIDILKNPQLAEDEKILATPTLSRVLPLPVRRIIGDLSDREKILVGLDLIVG